MQTLKMIIDKWSGPAGIMVIFCAIVWGVQLNVGMLRIVEEIGQLKEADIRHQIEQTQLSNDITRAAAILDSVANQLDALEERMTRNEGWISDNRFQSHQHNDNDR